MHPARTREVAGSVSALPSVLGRALPPAGSKIWLQLDPTTSSY
jgi:hypothetical protein